MDKDRAADVAGEEALWNMETKKWGDGKKIGGQIAHLHVTRLTARWNRSRTIMTASIRSGPVQKNGS